MISVTRARTLRGKPVWWFSSKSRKELEQFSRDFLGGKPPGPDKRSGMWDILVGRGTGKKAGRR